MTGQDEGELRSELVRTCRALSDRGLVRGTSGNVSQRVRDGILVSPTGIAYEAMSPDQVVKLRWDGSFDGDILPTSEWHFHLALLKQRGEFNAVVHTHSPYATAVSVLERDIPAIHYRIAVAGGPSIRCASYATFGTEALADATLVAMEGRRACLLAHHGVVAAHPRSCQRSGGRRSGGLRASGAHCPGNGS
jgi:L-fuculose-phosphate aldolase